MTEESQHPSLPAAPLGLMTVSPHLASGLPGLTTDWWLQSTFVQPLSHVSRHSMDPRISMTSAGVDVSDMKGDDVVQQQRLWGYDLERKKRLRVVGRWLDPTVPPSQSTM